MDEMITHAGEWFAKIDKCPHIYSVYTSEPNASKEFNAFKADNDEQHLRLLWSGLMCWLFMRSKLPKILTIQNKPAWIFLNILSCITTLNEYVPLSDRSVFISLKHKIAIILNFVYTFS